MNFIALMVILLTFGFMGGIVYIGETNNPSIQLLPSLLYKDKISFQTLFMIPWLIIVIAIIIMANTFRKLHQKANQNGELINLGNKQNDVNQFYTFLMISIVLLVIPFFVMSFGEELFVTKIVTKYTNICIIYFMVLFIFSILACYDAYDISKRFKFS